MDRMNVEVSAARAFDVEVRLTETDGPAVPGDSVLVLRMIDSDPTRAVQRAVARADQVFGKREMIGRLLPELGLSPMGRMGGGSAVR